MPTFSGTSNLGLTVLPPIRTNATQFVSLQLPQTALSNTKDRWGLMILGIPNAGGSVRVIETFKIFGGGLFVLPRWPVDTNVGQVILDWYRADLEWELIVPNNLAP